MKDLPAAARRLLAVVDKAPLDPGREKAAAARDLEARALVFSAQVHSKSGAHVRRLESWDHWCNRTGCSPETMTPRAARQALEVPIQNLNREFRGRGRLPWQGMPE